MDPVRYNSYAPDLFRESMASTVPHYLPEYPPLSRLSRLVEEGPFII